MFPLGESGHRRELGEKGVCMTGRGTTRTWTGRATRPLLEAAPCGCGSCESLSRGSQSRPGNWRRFSLLPRFYLLLP